MTRKFLRNTTSLALCIGVALPQLAAAQSVNDSIVLAAADEVAQAATEVILPPPAEDAEDEAEQEGEAAPEPDAASEAEAPPPESEPEPEPVTEPVAEPEPVSEPAPEAAAEPVAEDIPAETAPTAEEPVAETTSDAALDAQAEADADAEALARALAEQEEAAAANAASEADSGAAAESADTATEAVPPIDPAETAAETEVEAEAEAEAGAEAEAESATDAVEATTDANETATDTAETALPDAGELEAALTEAVEIPEAEAPVTDASREAAAADTAPEAAALADTDPVTTTEAEAVTEESSRSATEDFLTDLSGIVRDSGVATTTGAAATAAATQEADDDDDRSNLEKTLRQAVLPALAGLVVGQMLSNNRQVSLNTGDRVVVTRPDGSQEIIKDDNALLLRPGSTVQTQEYADGSTRTIVTRDDGSQVVTIRDANLRVLRRSLVRADGTTVDLLDDTVAVQPVDVAALPPPARPVTLAPGQQMSEEALREALGRETQVNRSFTLGQIRNIPEVRALVAPVDIQAITFDTGSAAIKSDQAQALSALGRVIAESIRQNPREIYLIEGHTDTVGADAMNLALSDRRAESVALALTQFFGVPPENMVVQGYGEQFLKVPREGDIRENRRASVRRITDLLARD